MPAYVHVCAECGREMVVPERFLGRELRCTGCGATFTAVIPATEVIPLPSEAIGGSGRRRWLITGSLAVAVAVAGLTLWLGGSQPGEPSRPRTLTLGDGSQPSHYAAFDPSTLRRGRPPPRRPRGDPRAPAAAAPRRLPRHRGTERNPGPGDHRGQW